MQTCLLVPHFPILRFPFPHFQRPRRIGRGRKYGRRRHKRRKWKVGVVVERVSATANLPAETCPDDVVAVCSPCRQLDWGLSHRTFVYSIACLPTIVCPMFVRFSRLHPDPGHVATAAATECHIVDSDILHARMSETYLDGHQPKHVSCLVRSSVRMNDASVFRWNVLLHSLSVCLSACPLLSMCVSVCVCARARLSVGRTSSIISQECSLWYYDLSLSCSPRMPSIIICNLPSDGFSDLSGAIYGRPM